MTVLMMMSSTGSAKRLKAKFKDLFALSTDIVDDIVTIMVQQLVTCLRDHIVSTPDQPKQDVNVMSSVDSIINASYFWRNWHDDVMFIVDAKVDKNRFWRDYITCRVYRRVFSHMTIMR
jgi:hypothetical protein